MSDPFLHPLTFPPVDPFELPVAFSLGREGSLSVQVGHRRMYQARDGHICFEITRDPQWGYSFKISDMSVTLQTGQTFPRERVEAILEPATDTLWAGLHAASLQAWMEALWEELLRVFPDPRDVTLQTSAVNAWLYRHNQTLRLQVAQPPIDRETEEHLRRLRSVGF